MTELTDRGTALRCKYCEACTFGVSNITKERNKNETSWQFFCYYHPSPQDMDLDMLERETSPSS